ncbi:MAG: pyruvate, phosphate dikinase [Limnochordia bacterium]|jgi:pyruvate,orthophosphate dikinase
MSVKKMVYFFGGGDSEGRAQMRNLLGGKGANLAEMASLGIRVPAGFTITTEVCIEYYNNRNKWPEGLAEQVRENLAKVEAAMGSKFNDPHNPLLFGIRSGARVSMPGMMDTVLNLGLNDVTAKGLVEATSNPRFVYDSYRRFVQMYSDVVLGVEHADFEALIEAQKAKKGVKLDTELTADDWKLLVGQFKALVAEKTGKPFPEDPWEQLKGAINAVFDSWYNPRAERYRQINDIPGDWGTAVNVQAMVFGNMGETSGTGVAFTRDPATGENIFYGEYLMNAQGEDVVAGIRTPLPIAQLEKTMPDVYAELVDIYHKLEEHYREMQDVEFTIQDGTLYMLQTRAGKRTAQAAVRIAVEMVAEGLIDKKTAVKRVPPGQLDHLLHPMIDPKAKVAVAAKGLPASPGAAVGQVVFTAADAEAWTEKGHAVILVRSETSPEDIGGMHVAQGILTSRGGMTSHAAVVARGMGKCCVAGCGDARIYEAQRYMQIGDQRLNEGDWITLNGTTGEVTIGKVELVEPEVSGELGQLMEWADEFRALGIRTNADTPHDAEVARNFGAEGIGLCRTEHMFFGEGRVLPVREMILAADAEGREKALAKLLPMQRDDFYGILKAMHDLPVTIRLLDPPLHEFVPHEEDAQAELAKVMGVSLQTVKDRVASLREFNPMLGHRGCRLGVTYPEIYRMQAEAIFQAACQLTKEGVKVFPEIMIPLVGFQDEFNRLKAEVVAVGEKVMAETGVKVGYTVGTMVEVPRAVLVADKIAEEAEFFSFGTNDLTQMGCGFSRDDATTFLPFYTENGIVEKDPFQVIDEEGIGQLVELGVQRGRKTRPDLKIGICGEHGGDPTSVDFCHRAGLNYVSCSPFRVPIAKLAAAQANIDSPR